MQRIFVIIFILISPPYYTFRGYTFLHLDTKETCIPFLPSPVTFEFLLFIQLWVLRVFPLINIYMNPDKTELTIKYHKRHLLHTKTQRIHSSEDPLLIVYSPSFIFVKLTHPAQAVLHETEIV